MGYFADIIKDSRLNLAVRRSPAVPLQDWDGQAPPTATELAGTTPAGPARRGAGQNSASGMATRSSPAAAAPFEPHEVSAEMVNAPRPQAKRLQRVKRSKDSRLPPIPADENAGAIGPIEASDERATTAVIQRKASTAAGSSRAAATGANPSGFRQPDWPSRSRPSPNRPASKRMAASLRPPGAAAEFPMRERPSRSGSAVRDRREAAIRQNVQPIEAETAPAADRSPAPAGQPIPPDDAVIPAAARLKGTTTIPALPPAPSSRSAHQVENVGIASARGQDAPRVRIGQVNVIVEESRVPPKAPPGDRRVDDLASRMFLRSL